MAPPVEKSPEAFRTISEVADWLGVPAHVLRFWESKFPQVKPVKRAGGRRYFRPADMRLLGGIRILLHEDGMTIKALQKKLAEEGTAGVADLSPSIAGADEPAEAGDGQVVRFARPGGDAPAAEAHAAAEDTAADPSAEAAPEPAAREDAPEQPTDGEEAERVAAQHGDAPERPTDSDEAEPDAARHEDAPTQPDGAVAGEAPGRRRHPRTRRRSIERGTAGASGPATGQGPRARAAPGPAPRPARRHAGRAGAGVAARRARRARLLGAGRAALDTGRAAASGRRSRGMTAPTNSPLPPCPRAQNGYDTAIVGLWRSLVARPSGGRKVAGSSPASPTMSADDIRRGAAMQGTAAAAWRA